MDKLKPCPFCSDNEITITVGIEQREFYYVMCINCLAQGSCMDSEEEAIKAWNTRYVKEG